MQSSLDWVPSLALIFVRAKRRENINRFKYFPEAVIFHRNKDGIENLELLGFKVSGKRDYPEKKLS